MSEPQVHNEEFETRLQEARREADEANARIVQVQESNARFASLLSHKLRTQLGIVQGYAEMLEAAIYGAINDGQRDAVDAIKESSARMLSLVDDMLDLARLNAGQLSLSYTPFSLPKLARDLKRAVAQQATNKGLDFVVDVAEDLPDFVIGDQRRVEQVVVNLINHAIDVTEVGGVHVRIYGDAVDRWVFVISDTSPSIPLELQEHVFEPFRTVTKTADSGRPDSGVNLHIVKRLVDLMGGTIQVQSITNKGRTFTVTVPLETISL